LTTVKMAALAPQDDGAAEPGVLPHQPEAGVQVAQESGRRSLAQRENGAESRPRERPPTRSGETTDHRVIREQVVAELGRVGELRLELAPRIRIGATLGAERGIEILELRRPLVDDLLLALGGQAERRDAGAHEPFRVMHGQPPPPAARPR
jgi:hypothetical protein